jgi:hypothetical protein
MMRISLTHDVSGTSGNMKPTGRITFRATFLRGMLLNDLTRKCQQNLPGFSAG